MGDATAGSGRSSESTRAGLTIPERLLLLERGQADMQVTLDAIESDVRAVAVDVSAMKPTIAELRTDVDETERWRQGLSDQIHGALRIPKVILAITPLAMFALGVIGFLTR